MSNNVPDRRDYTRGEQLSDAVVHVIGLAAALMAVPVLITLAIVWRADVGAVIGVSIYGVCLIAMLSCSALYHLVPLPDWKDVFRRLDHTAIYFKIAGTYTPFTLMTDGKGALMLTVLWAAALAGSSLKIIAPDRFQWLALGLYLAMGWAGAVMGWPLFSALTGGALWLIIIGGVIYTAGVAFYLLELMPYHKTLWHGFVLVATVVLFAAVMTELASGPAV